MSYIVITEYRKKTDNKEFILYDEFSTEEVARHFARSECRWDNVIKSTITFKDRVLHVYEGEQK